MILQREVGLPGEIHRHVFKKDNRPCEERGQLFKIMRYGAFGHVAQARNSSIMPNK